LTLTVANKLVRDGPADSKEVRYDLVDESGAIVASYCSYVGPHDSKSHDEAVDDAVEAERARLEAELAE
jgi:hypothetical protein